MLPLPEPWALLLDFDGSLVDIAATPAAVQVCAPLLQTLAELSAQRGGALACISGRAFADLRAWLGASGIALVGSHGAELLQAAPRDARITQLAQHCARALGAWPGALVEEKPCGLALHWRLAAAAEPMIRALAAQMAQELPGHRLGEGKKVLELVPRGVDKGSALRALMQRPPFAGRIPVFIGDDCTDICAMQAAQALGGWALAVGPRVAEHADATFANPAAVRAWLQSQRKQAPEGLCC